RPDSSLPDVGQLWRERIFFAVVYFALAVGLPVLVFTTLLAAVGGFWTGVIIFGPAYFIVAGITLYRPLSFQARVVLVMLVIYAGGTGSLIAVGPHFAGRLWLVAFAAFSCLMLGFRAGMAAVALNTLTVIGLGLFFGLGTDDPAILSGGLGRDVPFLTYWLLTGTAFVVLSLVIVVSIALLFRGLENSLKSERRSTRSLEEEREYLDLANRELEQEIRQRREAEEALKVSENQYRSLVENVPFGIFIVEIDSGRFIFLNQQICDLHGYTLEEALQLEVWDFIDPAQHKLMRSRMGTRLAGGVLSPATVVYTSRAKDGTAIRGEVWASVVTFQGRPAVQGVVRDVTEQELLEKQLQQAQKMEAVGTLAGGVAHEFNNILMAIRGYTQLLTMDGGLEAKPAGYIEKIEACTKRAADLTGKMLTFSRLDSGEKIAVQVNEAVEEIADLARHTFSPVFRIDLELDPDLPPIGANPYHLEQVLLNLAVNARDAMPEGGRIAIRTFRVDVNAEFRRVHPWAVADRYVEVVVEDQGCGMTPEQVERIFDPFYTTKDPGEGTGLGLAVAYSIIENHGGAIVAHSRFGRGSRFHVYLPVDDVLPAVIDSAAPRDDRDVSGRSILLVDDEDLVRDVARQALEHFGCRVVEAGHGREALALYRAARDQGRSFDLVLLDMAMPVMGGPECLDRLIEMDPGVRVLIVTGHDGQPGQDLLSRTIGVLHKPFDLIRLRHEIAQAMADKNGSDQ
ncbi:MAG: PAS domain S-box protein, partial [Proteobacteria bacterium]|nr:PAS domain S-box protein [Pseudomonadota bacterium]